MGFTGGATGQSSIAGWDIPELNGGLLKLRKSATSGGFPASDEQFAMVKITMKTIGHLQSIAKGHFP